jgi:hypothetical protein
MFVSRFIDAVMGLFGSGRIVIGEWPQKGVLSAAIREIEDAGGIAERTYGTPDGQYHCTRFRIRGRWLRLCAEEMDEVTALWPHTTHNGARDNTSAGGLTTAAPTEPYGYVVIAKSGSLVPHNPYNLQIFTRYQPWRDRLCRSCRIFPQSGL